MTKKQLHQIVHEFEELNTKTDIESASKCCMTILRLQDIGYDSIALYLSNNDYDNAHKWIDAMEV